MGRLEQFKVGDLIKLKRAHGDFGRALAIVLSRPLGWMAGRMKIQYFDKVAPFMTDPLRWKIVSRTSKMKKKC